MFTASRHKRIEPETHWAKVLAVHAAGLASRGYSEDLLSCNEPTGRLIERLRDSIDQAVKNTIWTYRIEEFAIGTEGRFPKQKESVSFQFTYHLDPSFNRLWLMSMKATLAETQLTFPVERNTWHQLPTPSEAHRQLIALSKSILLRKMKELEEKNPSKVKKKRN